MSWLVPLSVGDLIFNASAEFNKHIGKMGGFDVVKVVAGDGVDFHDHLGNAVNLLLEGVCRAVPVGGCFVGVDVVLHS